MFRSVALSGRADEFMEDFGMFVLSHSSCGSSFCFLGSFVM